MGYEMREIKAHIVELGSKLSQFRWIDPLPGIVGMEAPSIHGSQAPACHSGGFSASLGRVILVGSSSEGSGPRWLWVLPLMN